MRSSTYSPRGDGAAVTFANAKTPIDTSIVMTAGRGCPSDEAYHGMVLAASLRAGMTYLRSHAPAFAQRLVQPSVRTGAYGGTR